jgi:hypothetical protein
VKFFIDENLPHALADPLNTLFRSHVFRSCHDEGLSGTLDVPLFGELMVRGFAAIITKDARQVGRNDAERRALHDLGIHWIGAKDPAARGLRLLTAWMANLTAAMPHILDRLEQDSTPSWFSVKGIKHESVQRMTHGPLWQPQWNSLSAEPISKG